MSALSDFLLQHHRWMILVRMIAVLCRSHILLALLCAPVKCCKFYLGAMTRHDENIDVLVSVFSDLLRDTRLASCGVRLNHLKTDAVLEVLVHQPVGSN